MLSIDILNLVKYDNVKNISSKDYLSEDEYAYHVFDTKYCIRWDELGEVITDTSLPYFKIETPADVFWRVSSGLAAMESTEELQKHYRDAYFNFSIFHINFLHFFKIKRYAQIPKRLFVYFVHRKATLNNRKALEKAERIQYNSEQCLFFKLTYKINTTGRKSSREGTK